MTPAETIISKFGTQKNLADVLKIRQSNVSYWAKTGSIPSKWHSKIIEGAAINGIGISASDFIASEEVSEPPLPVAREANVRVLKPGKLSIGGIDVPCAVLSNGKRIFFQREIVGLLTGNKKGGFSRYLSARNLQPFLPEKFKNRSIEEAVFTFPYNGSIAQGFEATDLIEICWMYIQAKGARTPDGKDVLLDSQRGLAIQAEIITRSFSKLGVVAAIDEATGFLKAENEYQRLLAVYIAEDLQPWLTTFGETYYEQIYRLKGWDWGRYINQNKNHPWEVANITNRIVYEKLPTGVLQKLRELNPKNQKGNRKHPLYKHLASPGYLHLVKHLGHTEAIMERHETWSEALREIDTRFPSLQDPYGNPMLALQMRDLHMKKTALPAK